MDKLLRMIESIFHKSLHTLRSVAVGLVVVAQEQPSQPEDTLFHEGREGSGLGIVNDALALAGAGRGVCRRKGEHLDAVADGCDCTFWRQ